MPLTTSIKQLYTVSSYGLKSITNNSPCSKKLNSLNSLNHCKLLEYHSSDPKQTSLYKPKLKPHATQPQENLQFSTKDHQNDSKQPYIQIITSHKISNTHKIQPNSLSNHYQKNINRCKESLPHATRLKSIRSR